MVNGIFNTMLGARKARYFVWIYMAIFLFQLIFLRKWIFEISFLGFPNIVLWLNALILALIAIDYKRNAL